MKAQNGMKRTYALCSADLHSMVLTEGERIGEVPASRKISYLNLFSLLFKNLFWCFPLWVTFAIFRYSYINLLLLIGITLFLQVSLWLLQFSGLDSINNLKNISICSLWLIGLTIMASIWRWWQSYDITYLLKSWGERLRNRLIIKTNVFLLKSEVQSITQYAQKLSLFILAVPAPDTARCCRNRPVEDMMMMMSDLEE